ncbi:uncharacterized protein LOC123918349 [Trifolium pratense]|uniref:uncharacterized protein LOC123918349 n=1 Tax=Trifolium pratense TaxID=57577 RepID=UPI001E692FBC|nr:uncharacterized protein LOC123918349 [Trifolium pratense]
MCLDLLADIPHGSKSGTTPPSVDHLLGPAAYHLLNGLPAGLLPVLINTRQQPHDVSNHANGTTGWELTLVTARSSNESAEATSKLIGFEEDYFGVSDKVGCEGFNDSASNFDKVAREDLCKRINFSQVQAVGKFSL